MPPGENPTRRPLSMAEKKLLNEAVKLALLDSPQRLVLLEQIRSWPWAGYWLEAVILRTVKKHRLAGQSRDSDIRLLEEKLNLVRQPHHYSAHRMAEEIKELMGSASGIYYSDPHPWFSDSKLIFLAEVEYCLLALIGLSDVPVNLEIVLDEVRIPVEPRASEGREPHSSSDSLREELRGERVRDLGISGEGDQS